MDEAQWTMILTYVDEQVEESMTVAQIAAAAGYSPFHFNRLFAARIGMPVMEYMRMRKLQHAARQVAAGQRVLDVAVQYGFSSHEGFTRAFKRLHGSSPSRFRRLHAGTYQVPPPRLRQNRDRGDVNMEPRKETFARRTLIGYRLHTEPGSADIPRFWNEVMGDERWQRLADKAAPGATNYGLCIHPADMPEGKMDYLIAFDWDGETPPDKDMELFPLEAADYMAFPVAIKEEEETPAAIARTWQHIYATWFPASNLTCDSERPDFEAFHGQGRVEIFVPLKAN